ncbi:MAG: MMPL family transporter [Phycisphaerales bacterium]|nr:MMPL family transporter [Phycisphaerales bacterium]
MPLLPDRHRFFTAWARAVTARPRLVLVVAVLLAVASAALTAWRLEFRSDRSELIDPTLPWQRRYAAFKAAFPRWDDAVVVVDLSTAPDPATGEAYLAALESRLRSDAYFTGITAGFPRRQAPPGLIYTLPVDRVKAAAGALARSGPVLRAPTLAELLAPAAAAGRGGLGGLISEGQRAELRDLLSRAAAVGAADPSAPGPRSVLGADEADRTERLVSASGRLATVLVQLAAETAAPGSDAARAGGVNHRAEGIAALRGHLGALARDTRFSPIKAGVTGVPVLESDETEQSTRDATIGTVLSLVLITVLMLVAYRGWVVPMIAVASLLVGVAWSFAWATIAVGHLQLLSVVFASFLLGLGIDVAIHLIARLELVHADHEHLADAIARAFRGVGPGIVTATLTIAAAAAAMGLTRFAGVAEMGIIAAGGIVLCTASVMCCFPAGLMLIRSPERKLRVHGGGESRPYLGRFGLLMHRRPGLILGGAAAAFAIVGWLASGARYDPDLMKLMADRGESVVWQTALERDDAKSVWHAVVVARDDDEARKLTLALRQSPLVSDVGGVGMLYHPDDDTAAKRALLAALPEAPPLAEASGPAASAAADLRARARAIGEAWATRDPALAAAAARVAALTDDQLGSVQAAYARDRREVAAQLEALRRAEPARPSDLPPALRDIMIGTGGERLLRVYPAEPSPATDGAPVPGPLAPERLGPFVSAVLAVAPQATGPSVQIHESSALIVAAYAQAALLALGAIILLLLIDFRSPADAACALLPVLLGTVFMLGVMRVADVPLNFANMIVMPLIVGIGVGCGVHAVRRWRLQPLDRPPGLAGGSGRAITLTTVTTVIGFATMLVAEHRGIRSLGFVMSVGLVGVWLVTILILPAVLGLRRAGGVGASEAELVD